MPKAKVTKDPVRPASSAATGTSRTPVKVNTGGTPMWYKVIMFGLMYLNTWAMDHVFFSQTRMWMALYMGGAMALIGAFANHQHLPAAERMSKLSKLGTIDLRIDYLRPGRGQRFTATAMPLRAGNKVAVIRMELHNDEGVLVAVGTGTYLCG